MAEETQPTPQRGTPRAAPTAPQSPPKPVRAADDKVYTWPYLTRNEFLCAIALMAFLTIWSFGIDAPLEEIAELRGELAGGRGNPMEWKKRLGREIVTQFHSSADAEAAQAAFERQFQRRELPEDIPDFAIDQAMSVVDFAVAAGMASSKSEATPPIPATMAGMLSPTTLIASVRAISGSGGVFTVSQRVRNCSGLSTLMPSLRTSFSSSPIDSMFTAMIVLPVRVWYAPSLPNRYSPEPIRDLSLRPPGGRPSPGR